MFKIYLQGRGGSEKNIILKKWYTQYGGGSGTLLARPSANSKRKWEQETKESNRKRHCGLWCNYNLKIIYLSLLLTAQLMIYI